MQRLFLVATTFVSVLFVLATSGLLSACDPPEICQGTQISFTQCIAPTLTANCSGGGCHGSSDPAKGLILDENHHVNIVNQVVVVNGKQLPLIKPNDPDASYLFLKMIQDKPAAGNRMPSDFRPYLSDSQIQMFRTWISEGAKDDGNSNNNEPVEKPTIPAGIKNVSLTNDLLPIFKKSCYGSGCHGADSPAANLDFETTPHKNLVGTKSLKAKYTSQVIPGKPLESLFLLKVLEKRPKIVGSRMPLGRDFLNETETAQIYVWIEEGAKDN